MVDSKGEVIDEVVSSEIPALVARFWKSVMNFWKPLLKVPSSSQKVF